MYGVRSVRSWLCASGLWQDVRLPCPEVDLSSFHPAQGDLVEYEILATESQAAAWAVAQVASHSACLWRLQWLDRPGQLLMPLSRLRPHGERPLPSLEKAEVGVEMSVLGEDAATCFRRIESLAIGSVGRSSFLDLFRPCAIGNAPRNA